MGTADANQLRGIHSVMEVPIMDDAKWAKIPEINADAFFIDLEDSAPMAMKNEARERAVELMKDPAHLGGRIPIPRINNLDTDWGHDDIVAMAECGAKVVTYPKVQSAGELETVRNVFRKHGANPYLCAVIESAQGICNINEIVRIPELCGLFFGPSDLSLDAGIELYDDSGLTSGILDSARSTLSFAAASSGIELFDALFVKNMKDINQVRTSVQNSRQMGFSGVLTFYPPHIEIINDVFAVDSAAATRAERVVAAYENAVAEGKTAVLLDGEALIIQDYKRALSVLGRPF